MNTIDFSHEGGFKFTQEMFDYMQQSYVKAINALGALAGSGPTIIMGMVTGLDVSIHHTCTEGWLYYNGELLYCPATSVSDGDYGGADTDGWNIVDITTNRTYDDGSVFPALHSKIAQWGPVHAGAINAVRVTDLVPYGREGAYSSTALAHVGSGTTGTLFYKKNRLTGQLQYHLAFSVTTPSAFLDAPGGNNILLGNLPDGYHPVTPQHLLAAVSTNMGPYPPLNAGGYFNSVLVQIGANGLITATMVKPGASVAIINVQSEGFIAMD